MQQQFRRRFSPPNPSSNHKIASPTHHMSTAVWLFEDRVFNEWKSTPSPGLLWIHGKPGSGKSVLCSSIVKHVTALRSAGLAYVGYFSFDFRDESMQSCNNLLHSLLYQLSTQSDHFSDQLSHLHSLYEDGKQPPSDRTLTRCLKNMLSLSAYWVYLIIDGVDECPDTPAREQVLNLIEELVGHRLSNLHICTTSRPDVGALKDLTTHSISLHKQRGHKQDITNYIYSAVYSDPKMGFWSEKDKRLVVETVSRKADGVFRLACCQLQLLQHTLAPDLPRALPELPETLDQAYGQILKSIDRAYRDHAHRLLQCLAVAIRPLRVEELTQVLAVDSGTVGRAGVARVKSGWRTADQQQVMSVLYACSSLISIDSQVVQFSHFSVKEFLISERVANSRDISRYHISLRSAHTTLAQACLSVLLSLNGWSNLGDFPLAQYAANHWDDHVRFKKVSSDPRIRDMIQCFLDGDKSHWKVWHRLRDNDKSLPPSPDDCPVSLFYAAFYGLYDVVERLILKYPQYINPRVHSRATPLNAALMGNRFDVAQLLYNHSAKVNTMDSTKSTPLHVVFQASGQFVPSVKTLEWLLNHGAGVHVRSRDENERTPLHLAAENGPVDCVWMLIEHGAEIEAQDKHGRTPLHVAVGRQSPELVHILIKHKANVNSRDKQGKTPLHLAVQWRHFDISRTLIEYKANVNQRDKEGKTPLHVAAIWEHPDIARMLIKHRANVNQRDDEGMTPLHVAVRHGRHLIARTLIGHHANVNVQNNKGHTPLHVARHRGHHDIAQMLEGIVDKDSQHGLPTAGPWWLPA